jgi:hypothetical protein
MSLISLPPESFFIAISGTLGLYQPPLGRPDLLILFARLLQVLVLFLSLT